ncbi:tetraspanin-8-like [Girardinichthys multiradiatus]|uniref:tetraspanin-8-like n=1 Tax=Girardinichthys multiradiatus TaxID=208333 RepID=UPI001FACE483|nr:tetraspanin-8-like [Girardinichthys multiradiatus]
MGKVNILLKQSYTGVISVIGIIAILLLGFTLFGHGVITSHLEWEDNFMPSLLFFYGFSTVTLIFAVIGGFGVWKEKKWALILFAVGMILGCLYFIIAEIIGIAVLSQEEIMLKNKYLNLLPLSNMSDTDISLLVYAQSEFHCCGLESSRDWENIPESCKCDEDSIDLCVDASRHIGNLNDPLNTGPNSIYAKPCLPILIQHDIRIFHIALGILFGFMLLWILSIGLSIASLCQMNKKVDTPNVVYSTEAKAGNYSCLTEALEDG